LESCACDFSVLPSNNNGVTIISGCGDNCVYGIQVAKQFTDTGVTDDTCNGLVALQNNEVGRDVRKFSVVWLPIRNLKQALIVFTNPPFYVRRHTAIMMCFGAFV